MTETNLIIGTAGLPPQSARNCKQELSHISNGEFKKTINGNLVFLSGNERHRYKSSIVCKDINSPLADSFWIGSQVLIGCIQNLWQLIDPGKTRISLMRPAVSNSIYVVNNIGEKIKFKQKDNDVELYRPYENNVFVCFRPWMTMLVTDFSLEADEWGTNNGWNLQTEEV